ncbi:type II RES/Xre toxin-antitoxin system antitoxin [Desulfospira joergensenii]|uniref:type II RES/Xre toxin-antitoxin system antitoxin n=1 Tax=Desulfospira joergensenii TaxID=53329 RepID=UPI0003B55AD4|nr:antitoxin Xre/MbcA/ParS toxin-binding domain-containing protein [Desulfospira joergensenii]
MSSTDSAYENDIDYINVLRDKNVRSDVTTALMAFISSSGALALLTANQLLIPDQALLQKQFEQIGQSLSKQLGKDFISPIMPHLLSAASSPSFPELFPTKSLVKILEGGLGITLFKKVCALLNIPEKKLAELINLSVSTLAQRKKRGYFSQTESERLYRILNLYKFAICVFDDNPEYARKWLKEKSFGLGGETPLDFAKTEIGAKEVEKLLTRIDEGVFS